MLRITNPWIRFLPILVVHMVIISLFYSSELSGDEGRYLNYAYNILDGNYTDSNNPELRNGPGYPLFLSLVIFFGANRLTQILINAGLIYFALVFLYKSFRLYLNPLKSTALTLCVGLYPVLIKWMCYTHSEALTLFLSVLFVYNLLKFQSEDKIPAGYIVLGAFLLGYMTLTKVFFGYVILACGILVTTLYFIRRSKKTLSFIWVFLGALVVCLPYLVYTYSLTGNIFYWGTQGGEILYWHSTPYSGEYGDWVSNRIIRGLDNNDGYFDLSTLKENHGNIYNELMLLPHVERDQAFKRKAIENIETHPLKYFQNTVSSALRLFYNYPYSYTPQKLSTYVYIIPNSFLVVAILIAAVIAIMCRKKLAPEIVVLILLIIIYLGGIILLNGKPRHLLPVLPMLLVVISYLFEKMIQTKILK